MDLSGSINIVEGHHLVVLAGTEKLFVEMGELNLVDWGIRCSQSSDLRDIIGGWSSFAALIC